MNDSITEEEKDYEYVRQFIAGSEDAFNMIARKYSARIYWHARRMLGNHLDADEVAQEVLIVIYQKLKSFSFRSSLYTWIYRITSTRAINLINKRKIKRILFFEDSDQEYATSEEDFIKNVEEKERIENLNMILKKLPVKQREVFVLRHFDELSYEEIADITGKSIGGLKANYHHALKKVLELSEDYENK